LQAQKLLQETGTPTLAKAAIDVVQAGVDQKDQASNAQNDQYAKLLGYASYMELVSASTMLLGRNGQPWFISAVKHGKWLAWNEKVPFAARELDSREAAIRHVQEQSSHRSSIRFRSNSLFREGWNLSGHSGYRFDSFVDPHCRAAPQPTMGTMFRGLG
jgi:hypothetical protein